MTQGAIRASGGKTAGGREGANRKIGAQGTGMWQHRDHGGACEQVGPVETAPARVGPCKERERSWDTPLGHELRVMSAGEDSPGLWLHGCDSPPSGLLTASKRSWRLQSHTLPQRGGPMHSPAPHLDFG